jgi:hypothetical protein
VQPIGATGFLQRDKATQSYAKGQLNLNNFQNPEPLADAAVIREGVMRPIWVGDLLILARRVELGSRTVIQGCWLDWDKIKTALASEIVDVLPNVGLQPVHDEFDMAPGRRMATLPVQLTTSSKLATLFNDFAIRTPSRLKLSCSRLGWIGAGLAITMLLRGVADCRMRGVCVRRDS